jgi:protein SCO1/2
VSAGPLRRLALFVSCALGAALAAPLPAQFMTGRRVDQDRERGAALAAERLVREVGFDQNLGAALPLEARFRDESGREVRLGDYFGRGRPVLLAFVYYRCPMLCTLVADGVASSFKGIPFVPGREFEVVFLSIDPEDTPERAAAKKDAALARYGAAETAAGWHFLSGDAEAIAAATGAAGFRYVRDAGSGEYAHAAGLVLATADGRISRYVFGIDYAPRDLKLALVEASEGRIGGVVDRLLLLCYHYDAAMGRYTAVSMLALRLLAAATLAALVCYVLFSLSRERRARRRLAAGGAASV